MQSASVARLVEVHGGDKRILLQACPGLVELVERADLHSADAEDLLRQLVEPLLAEGVDTLVLGCTHYPFLRDIIQRLAGSDVVLLDPAQAVARELTRRLADHGGLSVQTEPGHVQFFTSGDVGQAQAVMSHLWNEPLTVHALP